jgi:hypothetical protein
LTPVQRTEESIAMQRTGSLVVVVKTKGGEVLANGEVQAVTSTGMTRWTLTDAFGVARFETIAEGKVALHATGFPQATATVAAGEVAQTVVEK